MNMKPSEGNKKADEFITETQGQEAKQLRGT